MNTEYAIMSNMYYQGMVNHENMATMKIKDCIVEISRDEVSKEFLNIQYCYRCNIVFKDLLGRELKRLCFNEAQAMVLVDNLGRFQGTNEPCDELYCLSNIYGSTPFESYGIIVKMSNDSNNPVLLQVQCYNSVSQMMFPCLTIPMTFDELDSLCDLMFFIYLIDIASERQSIYKV